MKKLYWILCLACLSLPVSAQSSAEFCDKYAADIMNKIKVKPDRNIGDDKPQCKIWPANPQLALLAWQLDDTNYVAYDEQDNSDIQIVIASAATGKIISQFIDESAMINDAIKSGNLTLDTAQYKLNQSTTAFGLRYSQSSLQYLNLYTFKNNKVEKILKDVLINVKYREELINGCSALTREYKSFIIMQNKKMKNGFASLLFKKTLTDGKIIPVAGTDSCEKGPSKTTKDSAVLTFDGTRYNVPEDFNNFLYGT